MSGGASPEDVRRALAGAVRDSHARLIGGLGRRAGGDLFRAEDALGEACAEALERWPRSGIPERPGAWLWTAAMARLVDGHRSERARRDREALRGADTPEAADGPARDDAIDFGSADDTLRLLFACCHPSLDPRSRVALTLNAVSGLQASLIARAFLVDDGAMSKRIVRAKAKIRDAGIGMEVPAAGELPERLPDVLKVIELIFNEGYVSSRSGADRLTTPDLAREALRLAGELAALVPDEPEVIGLVALIELTHARAAAREAPEGGLVTLRDQDRSLWDRDAVERGLAHLDRAARLGGDGPFVLRAALSAEHSRAARPEDTDWTRIVALYDALLRREPSGVVQLNRAVAVGEVSGPGPMLEALAAIDDRAVWSSHYGWVAKAEALGRCGRAVEARGAFAEALRRVRSDVERRHIEGMMAALDDQ